MIRINKKCEAGMNKLSLNLFAVLLLSMVLYNENWQVLAEYDGGGNFTKLNVFGNYIDESSLMVDDELASRFPQLSFGNISERFLEF